MLGGHVPSIDRAAEICDALGLEFYVGPVRGRGRSCSGLSGPFAAGPSAATAARGGRAEPSDVEKSVHGLVRAVLAADGNLFPPDLRDDTLTALVATHEAPPGTRPVDVVEFLAKRGGGWELTSDNPAVEPEPWPAEAEAVGEVVWAALTLI